MRPGFLWLAGFRDLQWRRRRFVIAVLGSSLVFAITLLMTGFLSSFSLEIDRTTEIVGAEGFIVPEGRPGPYTGTAPLAGETVDEVRKLDGVKAAHAIVSALQVTDRPYRPDVYLIGAEPNGFGSPKPSQGRVPRDAGEAVVDTSAHLDIGDEFTVGSVRFTVVGLTSGLTAIGFHPVVFVSLEDAQLALFGGISLVTAIGVEGAPTVVPPGLAYVDETAARADLKRPLRDTMDSIKLFRSLMWIVATAIVGSVVYLSALERLGDFAVFKAIGTSTSDLLAALMFQAIVLSVSASVLAIGLARLIAPLNAVSVQFPMRNQLALPLAGLAIGALASVVALRRAVTVDPALAFGGH